MVKFSCVGRVILKSRSFFLTNASIVLLTVSIFSTSAQDIIILRNEVEIKARVIEVNLSTIQYKPFENLNGGHTIMIYKSNVHAINYENGKRDIINPLRTTNTAQIAKIISSNDKATDKQQSNTKLGVHERQTKFSVGVNGLFGYANKYEDYGIGLKFSYIIANPIRLSGEFGILWGHKVLGQLNTKTTEWKDYSVYVHYMIPAGEGIFYPLVGIGMVDYSENLVGFLYLNNNSETNFVVSLGIGSEYALSRIKNIFFTGEIRGKILNIDEKVGVRFHIASGLTYKF